MAPGPETGPATPSPWRDDIDDDEISLLEVAAPLLTHWKLIVFSSLLAGALALGVTFVVAPIFTARTTFLPPQQQQSAAASALASLGGLAALTGAGAALKSPADQYVALMQSVTVQDRLIDQFKLLTVYDKKLRVDARVELGKQVRISTGKKDGLVSVEVDDKSPERAAQMANQHVEELRRLTSILAVSEAQQRRAFFERELKQTRDRLGEAQLALQGSGFNQSTLKAEPKAAAEGYARLRAEVTAAEVRLQTLRGSLAEQATEVQQQLATLAALRAELARSEQATQLSGGPDYISKYREFKYQETLFELFARQYEMARVDESREGALIQVVDMASPPEKRSWPKRRVVVPLAILATALLLAAFVVIRAAIRRSMRKPANVSTLQRAGLSPRAS